MTNYRNGMVTTLHAGFLMDGKDNEDSSMVSTPSISWSYQVYGAQETAYIRHRGHTAQYWAAYNNIRTDMM